MSRRSYQEEARERLLRFWECDAEAGAPIGCVATTFTFSAAFFEEECLARFVGVETDPREDGRAYLIEREEKLSQVFAAVLVDRAHVAPHRSLRWHLLPVRVPGGGAMHAKVTLLVWDHRIRALLGSANLTDPGYRCNLEHLTALDFGPHSEIPLSLLEEIVEFLSRLRRLAPGAEAHGAEGPQAALDHFLTEVRRRAEDWNRGTWGRGEPQASFLGLWPGEPTLFERLGGLFPGRAGPKRARVLSPFFDEGAAARRTVDALVATMGVHGERHIDFLVAGHELDDEARTVELALPGCLREPWNRRLTHGFQLVREKDENGEARPLHAKSLWLERDERAVYLVGSSNFTAAGTGVAGLHANVEANLAYLLPSATSPFARRCEAAYPPAEVLDLEERTVRFLQVSDRTPEAEGTALLPEAFGLALFRPEAAGGVLRLAIFKGAPAGFVVLSETAETIETEAAWLRAGRPTEREHPWQAAKPPSHLRVAWTDPSQQRHEAIWIVNVTDGSRLPPPDELRALDLDELLDILTSARPLHEAVRELLRRRELREKAAPVRPDSEVDPHRKVDTRNFLLRRMRRVAAGLEGLRERLERPAWHIDALRWRLHGPVGPIALARKLAEQERQAGAFMLAEVALTVHRADWSRLEASIGRDTVHAEVGSVLDTLATLAREAESPSNLAGYVRDAFEEMGR